MWTNGSSFLTRPQVYRFARVSRPGGGGVWWWQSTDHPCESKGQRRLEVGDAQRKTSVIPAHTGIQARSKPLWLRCLLRRGGGMLKEGPSFHRALRLTQGGRRIGLWPPRQGRVFCGARQTDGIPVFHRDVDSPRQGARSSRHLTVVMRMANLVARRRTKVRLRHVGAPVALRKRRRTARLQRLAAKLPSPLLTY